MGVSNVSSLSFKTGKLSYGFVIRVPLIINLLNSTTVDIIPPEDVIEALSNTLRVPQSQLLSETSLEDLQS